jgi:glyoxylase I family protein
VKGTRDSLRPLQPENDLNGETTKMTSNSDIPIRGLDHVVLRVRNLEASLAFYSEALGLSVERELPLPLGLFQLRAGSALIDLVPLEGELGKAGGAGPGPEGRNVDHFCLQVEPFDEVAIRARLERYGIAASPVATRYGAQGNGPSIYLSDPDGNTVELKGPGD